MTGIIGGNYQLILCLEIEEYFMINSRRAEIYDYNNLGTGFEMQTPLPTQKPEKKPRPEPGKKLPQPIGDPQAPKDQIIAPGSSTGGGASLI